MSYEESLRSVSLNADATIAVYTGVPGQPGSLSPNGGFQYRCVKITGANQVGLADTTANEVIVGILQNKPQNTGMAATVAIHGISNVMCGAAITAGAPVKVTSVGKVTTATLPADFNLMVGIALKTSTATDQLIPVLLRIS